MVQMRILMVSQYFPPFFPYSGPAEKIKTIAQKMAERGHEVTVLTSGLQSPNRFRMQKGSTFPDRPVLSVVYIPALLRFRALTFNPSIIRFAQRYLKEFDVVHFFGYYDLLAPSVAHFARRDGIPYILEPLGMMVPLIRNLTLKKLYHRFLGNKIVTGANKIVVNSEQEYDQLVESKLIGATKTVIRRNGINLADYSNLPARGKFRKELGISEGQIVLFLGRIAPIKSLDMLIRAFAGVPIQQATLVLVGPDEKDGHLNQIDSLRQRLGLGDRVRFMGPLYGESKLSALVDADVVVLVSRQESFGNAIAEAIAVGKPVIVSEGCGIASYVQHQVGLVVPHDEYAVRNAIGRLLEDKELYSTFESNCSQVASQLTWDEPMDRMESLYLETVNSRNCPSREIH